MGSNGEESAVRFGDVTGSAFSIGGSNNRNTVRQAGGRDDDGVPGAAELLEAVRALRAELVRMPRSTGRVELDAELEEAADRLEEAEEIRPGLAARLRGALERWAPLVESVSAATALGGLLASLGG
ncbi:hypothetical protein [Streptomyces katrae]|uniref:hypothetical protein n=1 Tax=Streptomyces katrae TaxID=68223 RepID=UPI00068B0AC8|nr:hypothetical protein [Streptomyces katrae]